MEVTAFKPGNFCWFELATSNQGGAKDFYSQLFGWGTNDQPMGPDLFYTMLEKSGKPVGALYGMDASQLERGVPPHWNIYISVDDVDAATAKAKSLGANVMMEPFDVMDAGRMSAIQDPTGAPIMLWQSAKHQGASVVDESNAFCWYELNTHDTDKAKQFYSNLFGWAVGGSPEYTEWKQGDRSLGGMMQIQPEWGEMPPSWTAYVMVDDIDQSAEKAKSLGGNVVTGPMDIPGTGRFAIVSDPQNAVFAMFQPIRK